MGCNCGNKGRGRIRWEVYLIDTGEVRDRNVFSKVAAEALRKRYGVGPDNKPKAAIREVKA